VKRNEATQTAISSHKQIIATTCATTDHSSSCNATDVKVGGTSISALTRSRFSVLHTNASWNG